MGVNRRLLAAAVLVTAMLLPASLMAADVPVVQDFWAGSRSSENAAQIFAYGDWDGDFKIEWVIEKPSYFTYRYIISDLSGGSLDKAMSHLVVQVSSPFAWGVTSASDGWGFSLTPDGQAATYSPDSQGGSNPGMPASGIFGLKFNTPEPAANQPVVIQFNSWRAPVWGDFYAVDGKKEPIPVAYNAGFGLQPGGTFDAWIARPDTRVYIPEPVFFQFGAMMGFGGLGVLKLRKR